ncbi:hypothetical protein BH10BAC3_BH10BAC3_31980 [soil metagenome]
MGPNRLQQVQPELVVQDSGNKMTISKTRGFTNSETFWRTGRVRNLRLKCSIDKGFRNGSQFVTESVTDRNTYEIYALKELIDYQI